MPLHNSDCDYGRAADGTAIGPFKFQDEYFVSWTCAEMLAVQRLAQEIARTDFPVLILGESGTGKEVLATQIHELSRDRELPFVKLSCTAFVTDSFQAQLRKLESGWRAKN